jgi:hypothetical protein
MLILSSPKIVGVSTFWKPASAYKHVDNVAYYKCDVSKWEEVEAVSKKVVEEVSFICLPNTSNI